MQNRRTRHLTRKYAIRPPISPPKMVHCWHNDLGDGRGETICPFVTDKNIYGSYCALSVFDVLGGFTTFKGILRYGERVQAT